MFVLPKPWASIAWFVGTVVAEVLFSSIKRWFHLVQGMLTLCLHFTFCFENFAFDFWALTPKFSIGRTSHIQEKFATEKLYHQTETDLSKNPTTKEKYAGTDSKTSWLNLTYDVLLVANITTFTHINEQPGQSILQPKAKGTFS